MTLQQRMMKSASRLVRHFGDEGSVTIKRPSRLKDALNGRVASTASINGNFSIGDDTIDLDGSGLQGVLISGISFTIAGDTTVYETKNFVAAVGGALNGVEISPALAAAPADDATVTFQSTVAEYAVRAAVARFTEDAIDNDRIQADDYNLLVDLTGLVITPELSDSVELLGDTLHVFSARPILSTGGGIAIYRLHIGNAR